MGLISYLHDTADSIRSKTGGTELLKIEQFPPEIDSIITTTDIEDGLITGTLTNYTNNRITAMRGYAFYQYRGLEHACFNNLEILPSYSFAYCSIITMEIANCTRLNSAAFAHATTLEWISFDNITRVPNIQNTNVFTDTPALVSIYVPQDMITPISENQMWIDCDLVSKLKPLSEKPALRLLNEYRKNIIMPIEKQLEIKQQLEREEKEMQLKEQKEQGRI